MPASSISTLDRIRAEQLGQSQAVRPDCVVPRPSNSSKKIRDPIERLAAGAGRPQRRRARSAVWRRRRRGCGVDQIDDSVDHARPPPHDHTDARHGARHRQQFLNALPPSLPVGQIRHRLGHEALVVTHWQGEDAEQAGGQAVAGVVPQDRAALVSHTTRSAIAGPTIWTTFATSLTHGGQAPFRSTATRLQSLASATTGLVGPAIWPTHGPFPCHCRPPSPTTWSRPPLRFWSDTVGAYGKSNWL
jgi:hypothetical protein